MPLDHPQRATPLTADAVAQGLRPGRVGLLAGWGSFPVEVAQHLHDAQRELFVVAFKGHADARLEQLATEVRWMGILKIGAHLRYFQRAGVTQVVMAGKLFKDRILYEGWGWMGHLPDWTSLRVLGPSFVTRTRDGRDDTILHAVTEVYRRRGMTVLPITEVAPQLLSPEGCLTKRRPTAAQLLDIRFGWQIARSMGGLDIGQSITVRDQLVLGVEAIEGTDALIARTGQLCPRGGFTLIKVAKPQQDMRFDVPTVGLRTLQQLARAGGTVVAIEADRTLLVDRQATLDFANARGMVIVAMPASEPALALQPSKTEHTLPTSPPAMQNISRVA